MTTTVVIGGGIAGLATAALLAREGHEVHLLEQRSELGGRAGTLTDQGFTFDTGPSWYLMPRVFDHFFEMMGTSTQEQLDLVDLDPGYRVYSEGSPQAGCTDIPFGLENVVETFESLEPGSGEALRDYIDSARTTSEQAERHFLYNPFTSPRGLLTAEVLRGLPRLGQLLLTPLRRFIAARFSHPVLRQILGYPAVFLGTRPEDAPAMYHLMSALDLEVGVQYPQGGFSAVVDSIERLAREAGVQITTEAEVTRILTQDRSRTDGVGGRLRGMRASAGRLLRRYVPAAQSADRDAEGRGTLRRGGEVTGVRYRDADGAEHYRPADIVVSGADLHHTETALLAEADRSYPESWWSRRISGPGAVLVMLGVRGELPQLEHHTLFFTADWEANFEAIFGDDPSVPTPASAYVCKPSATDDVAPAGHENLFILIPVPADPGIGGGGVAGAGDAQIEATADAAIDQISRWADIPDLHERIVVRHTMGPGDFQREYHSWRGGMLGPAHTLRQSAMFRAQNASPAVNGLYYSGASVAPGVGVPMCLISAELVLKRIRGDHSSGPLPTAGPLTTKPLTNEPLTAQASPSASEAREGPAR